MSSRIRKAKFNNIKRLNEGILNEQRPDVSPVKKPFKPSTSKGGYDCNRRWCCW